MKIVTYLGFTLLSILIQFSVLDFIQTLMQQDDTVIDGLNGTSHKRFLRDVFKDLSSRPHALYYQTQSHKGKNAKIIDNTSLPDLLTSTETTTAVFEVLYDESTSSVTDDDIPFTTEEVYSSTEFDNVTDLTIFGKTNKTQTKPRVPKKRIDKSCKCNFLFEICDVNCCCDVDCTEDQIKMFQNCTKSKKEIHHNTDVCYDHLFYFGHEEGPMSTILNDWFCIVKVNLPDAATQPKKTIHLHSSSNFYNWKALHKPDMLYEFTNKIYSNGDPIWLTKNGSIYYIDLPSPTLNSYCAGRKTIQFLNGQTITCQSKITDLEMFQIMKRTENASVISATPLSMNNSILNCTNLHCINWTLLICEDLHCTNYNKSLHEPVCNEVICTNIALRLEYIFNYHDSKITNATIKLHVQKIPVKVLFLTQEISVKFILTNESTNNVRRLSGNPGYIENMPIIISHAKNNHTNVFFNTTAQSTYIFLPGNKNGICIESIIADNLVLFGINRRIKCRLHHRLPKPSNSTEQCKIIQNNINKLFDLRKFAVSPIGDPIDLKDEEWITVNATITDKAYGELNNKRSKLRCFNIITRYSYIFSYAEEDGNLRVFDTKLESTLTNASFHVDDLSGVVTIDVGFVDLTRPKVIDDASGPKFNFHLPNDLFFPFPSSDAQMVCANVLYLIICISILVFK